MLGPQTKIPNYECTDPDLTGALNIETESSKALALYRLIGRKSIGIRDAFDLDEYACNGNFDGINISEGDIKPGRSYWIVSPNVRDNHKTVSDWKNAILMSRAAFMGYKPSDTGHEGMSRFAKEIAPDDVIMIARRHQNGPDLVGFGVVKGTYKKAADNLKAPERFGSLRHLRPFFPWTKPPQQLRSSMYFPTTYL